MNPSKARRNRFRRSLAANGLVHQDRFSEMMGAVLAGGSLKCGCCGLLQPAARIDDAGFCVTCKNSLGKMRIAPPAPREPSVGFVLEAGCVYVDASYKDGIAGLAVVGALGEHSRKVEASSSTHAEVLALRWAMEIAWAGKVTDLVFRTDCEAACRTHRYGFAKRRWTVEQIPRHKNAAADRVAFEARIARAA